MTSNLRIKGVVKTAKTVQNLLSMGIKIEELAKFKHYIKTNLEAIENICTEHGTQPDNLPTRSRKAYYFLKEINLDNLPIISSESKAISTIKPSSKIRLKNIVKQQKIILEDIFNSCDASNADNFDRLRHNLTSNVISIENICQNHQSTPANLSNSSRQIYSWMKFLTNPSWLEKHLTATCKTKEIAKKIAKSNLVKSESVFTSFTNTASLYKSKKDRYQHNIILNEGFITANEEMISLILTTIFQGKSSKTSQIIRQYTLTEEYTDIILELDLSAEIDADNPQGQYYDLNLLFEKINSQYFDNSLNKPRLSWSQSLTRRKFGHYEPHKDRVVISLSLDNQNTPSFVPEFILYHELLHKYCGEKWVNGKRRVHTPEFKKLEQQFEFYQNAEAWLQKFSHFAEL